MVVVVEVMMVVVVVVVMVVGGGSGGGGGGGGGGGSRWWLGCLDKTAILPKDSVPRPWEVCTVTEVEKVKIIIRMLPIIASTILMNTCLAQLQTFSVQQGSTMNLYLGSLEVPASSIPVIPLVFMTILAPIYEYIFIPFAQKITHQPSGVTQLQRVGVGLVLSAISMGVAGIAEVKRRNQDIKDPTKNISLFWLSFQYCIFGIADMFTLVSLIEFFYKEAPSGMKSLSTSFTFLSVAIGYFLSSIFASAINSITKMGRRKTGWLAGATLNESRLDLFYWFLAMLSCLNFANYLIWASWYKYKSDDNSSTTIGSSFHKEESNEAVEAKPNSPASPIDSWLKDEASEKAPEGVKTMPNSPSSRNHTA
ncbi:hypothetical protein IFM89_029321 [Coptis chinensis]|uniref:Uncharacterized protein n=1 Tax=Coptis chinensis TaxID=261450 RepID=A0A835ITK6_9MAGN|nr:hypothetical protein IFM89_029321 [Coptis chinensis]